MISNFKLDHVLDVRTFLAVQEPFAFSIAVRIASRDLSFSKDDFGKTFLSYFIQKEHNSPRVRLGILLAARHKDPRNTSILPMALKDPSPDVRRVAVQWVAEERLTELKPHVEAVLNGKVMNADLFLATLAALEMLDGKRPQDFDKTPAGRYVLPLVKDGNRPAAVRAVALRLVDPDEPSLSESLFKQMLAAKDGKLKTEAVRTLQQSQRPFAGKLLAAIALDEKSPATLRADAVAGLAGRAYRNNGGSSPYASLVKIINANKPQSPLFLEALRALRPSAKPTAYEAATTKIVRAQLEHQLKIKKELDPKALKTNGALFPIAEELAFNYVQADKRLPDWLQSVQAKRPKTAAAWIQFTAKGGNAAAGRRVFFRANSAGCYKCHTVNGRGGNIGPDLTNIARTADRRKLAESILEPSKEIAPQFTLWSFVMDDGKVHHGVILGDTRDGKRQRIGTPEGRLVDLSLTRIELRTPQQKSVMPENLIDRLTATEFRDLLAFLETLK
jgi:putative heme-binding domain-containing protein